MMPMVTKSTSDVQVSDRIERIGVPVTAAEKRKFEKLAEARHVPLSVLIRQVLHELADKPAA